MFWDVCALQVVLATVCTENGSYEFDALVIVGVHQQIVEVTTNGD